ncbi:hypothetical protein [Gimesia sp.]|uniref:hypothetical protein n=1 Tax=Gimesia sp. TaxID=2024833 RepID=UPI003A94C67C
MTVNAPAELVIHGSKWQRESSIGKSDGKLLAHYFQQNPSMVGSPELAGTPEVYHGASQQRRFYWIHSSLNKTVWTCVEYKDREFHFLQGEGNPYQ